jgi:diadenylate cyclase
VERFGSLQQILAASMEDLATVNGLTVNQARTVREALSRIAEASMLA